jgi:predicted nucleotidyltransferase
MTVEKLRAEQVVALRSLVDIWPDTSICLVGAGALQCHYESFWRQTEDLDITIAAGTDDVQRLSGHSDWRRDPKIEQRWYAPGGVKVDLIPAGPALLEAGEVVWPESDFRMNLAGFRLAFEHSLPLQLGNQTIGIAPPQVIGLLKMIAYLDRPEVRGRDLTDLAYLLEEYLPPDDDRRYAEDMLEAGIAYHDTAAYSFGRDLGAITNEKESSLVREWTFKMKALATDGISRTSRIFPLVWPGDGSEHFVGLIRVLERGFTARRSHKRALEPPFPISSNGEPTRER